METTMLPFLLANALKGTLLLALAGAAAVQLRRSSAAARHLVWHIALLGVLALPVVALVAPSWEVLPSLGLERLAPPNPSAPAATITPAGSGAASEVSSRLQFGEGTGIGGNDVAAQAATGDLSSSAKQEVAGAQQTRGAAAIPLSSWLLLLWLLGATLVLSRLALGTFVVHWFTWRAQPVEAASWASLNETMSFAVGLGHPVRLLKSERTATPMTFGVLNPVVLLPRDADEWPEDRRRVVLLHELAHVQRLDSLTNLFATLACALYWFNPLVWVAAAHMRSERERACDDWVLRAGMRASTYAEHLLDMVRTIGRLHTPAAALPMAQRSTFEGRLLAILEPGMNRNGTRRGQAVLLIGAIALLVLPLAALTAPATAHTTEVGEVAPPAEQETSDRAGILERLTSLLPGRTPKADAIKEGRAGDKEGHDSDTPEAWQEQEPAGLNARALAALIEALGDSDVAVRTASIEALGTAQDPRSIAALSAALRNDKDAGVRKAAAWALGNIEDERAVPALLDALRADSDVAVRRMAAWALGQIESATAIAGLGVAVRDADKELRETAVWALGEIEEAEAIPALAEVLKDGDAGIRQQAAWALGQIGESAAITPLAGALRDSDANVRNTAVWALGQIGDEAGVDPLIALVSDSDADVRARAAWALGQIESERAVPGLSRLVTDASAAVRETATWALGQIGDQAGAAALATALKDAEPGVRSSAAWALGQIGERPAPPALLEALRDESVEVRRTAVWALGQIEDPNATAALRGALQDADTQVKRGAMRALAGLGDDAAYQALAELLKDPDPAVRKQAAEALGGHGGWPDPQPRPRPEPRPDPRPRPNGW